MIEKDFTVHTGILYPFQMVPYHMMICWTGVSKHTRTGQPGLWLIAGGLAQCRIRSKHLALQIKAIEEGLLQR
jgi:hypothetical protein